MQDPKAPQHKILQILPLFLQILPFSEVIKRDFLLFLAHRIEHSELNNLDLIDNMQDMQEDNRSIPLLHVHNTWDCPSVMGTVNKKYLNCASQFFKENFLKNRISLHKDSYHFDIQVITLWRLTILASMEPP